MDELISRRSLQAAIEETRKAKLFQHSVLTTGDVVRLVLVEPAVPNVAEIVHCRDCIHSDTNMRTPAGAHWCKCLNCFMADQFFCAYGRKKGVKV